MPFGIRREVKTEELPPEVREYVDKMTAPLHTNMAMAVREYSVGDADGREKVMADLRSIVGTSLRVYRRSEKRLVEARVIGVRVGDGTLPLVRCRIESGDYSGYEFELRGYGVVRLVCMGELRSPDLGWVRNLGIPTAHLTSRRDQYELNGIETPAGHP